MFATLFLGSLQLSGMNKIILKTIEKEEEFFDTANNEEDDRNETSGHFRKYKKDSKLQACIGFATDVLSRNNRDWPTKLSSHILGLTISLCVHFMQKITYKQEALSLGESFGCYGFGSIMGGGVRWLIYYSPCELVCNTGTQVQEDLATIKNYTHDLYQQFMAKIVAKKGI